MATYEQAERALEAFYARDHGAIADFGRSILLTHGARAERAAILLHGMSASPAQFRQFSQELYERGYNVFVPRLPRHGHADRMTTALAGLQAPALKNTTLQAIEIGRGLGERLTLIGFSLGGLLAAWAAQYHRVDCVMSIAPFLGVSWVPRHFAAVLAPLALRLPNRFPWWDPIQRERQMPAHGYPRYSTHALAQAYSIAHDLLHDAIAHAPRAKQILLITNARESTISNPSVRLLMMRWQKHAAPVRRYEFTDLPFSHDIIEPLRAGGRHVAVVYPKLHELLEQ